MLHRLTFPVALAAVLLAGGALAQSKSNSSNANTNNLSNANSSSSTSRQSLPHQLESKLRDQGFTDVQVVPGSYLVSAKDKQGDPVTMVLGPHSMAVFTVNSSSTVGSSSDQKPKGSEK